MKPADVILHPTALASPYAIAVVHLQLEALVSGKRPRKPRLALLASPAAIGGRS